MIGGGDKSQQCTQRQYLKHCLSVIVGKAERDYVDQPCNTSFDTHLYVYVFPSAA